MDDDEEPFIDDESKCSACGTYIDLEDGVSGLNFEAERSGVSPDYVDGFDTHWAEGHIVCPGCRARLWIQVA